MKNIRFFTTEDGSPTAYFENFEQEKMHHSGGAFGETVYIYGPAMQWGFAIIEKPSILSLGTGLAYNEILSAAFAVLFDAELEMTSYESNTDLNSALIAWVTGGDEGIVPFEVYDTILDQTAETFGIQSKDIKSHLANSFKTGCWKVRGAWDSQDDSKYNVILYDFFSSKAMEQFWEENFLKNFLEENADGSCAFATYACTGKLKRALKDNDFQFYERKGYKWKRSSTFACRKKTSRS